MEPMAFAVDRIKEFGITTQRFVTEVLQNWHKRSSQTPIETLKRLQREAFSDLMKVRDRQDKVERILAFYQSGKGNAFQEASTRMNGIVNANGVLMFVENDYLQASNNLDRVGQRRGIDLRFIFETPIKQDLLLAEFLASQCCLVRCGDVNGCSLILAKLAYLANVSDWLSAVFVPLGAACTDFGVTNVQQGGNSVNRCTSFSPPLFHQHQTCGIGFMVKESKVAASIAGLASRHCSELDGVGNMGLSTFWQVSYKPFEDARLTMSSVWQARRWSSHLLKVGPIALPTGFVKQVETVKAHTQACSSAIPMKVGDSAAAASLALMLESQFDECTNFDCWIEMQKSSPSSFKWGLSLSDTPQDELGWGLKVGGEVEGHLNQFWLEGFLNCNFRKKAVLQPGFVYVVNGKSRTPALVFRSSWFM